MNIETLTEHDIISNPDTHSYYRGKRLYGESLNFHASDIPVLKNAIAQNHLPIRLHLLDQNNSSRKLFDNAFYEGDQWYPAIWEPDAPVVWTIDANPRLADFYAERFRLLLEQQIISDNIRNIHSQKWVDSINRIRSLIPDNENLRIPHEKYLTKIKTSGIDLLPALILRAELMNIDPKDSSVASKTMPFESGIARWYSSQQEFWTRYNIMKRQLERTRGKRLFAIFGQCMEPIYRDDEKLSPDDNTINIPYRPNRLPQMIGRAIGMRISDPAFQDIDHGEIAAVTGRYLLPDQRIVLRIETCQKTPTHSRVRYLDEQQLISYGLINPQRDLSGYISVPKTRREYNSMISLQPFPSSERLVLFGEK